MLKRIYIEMPDKASGGARYMATAQLSGYMIVNTAVPLSTIAKLLVIHMPLPERTLDWLISQHEQQRCTTKSSN